MPASRSSVSLRRTSTACRFCLRAVTFSDGSESTTDLQRAGGLMREAEAIAQDCPRSSMLSRFGEEGISRHGAEETMSELK